jgi:hypothetical protein
MLLDAAYAFSISTTAIVELVIRISITITAKYAMKVALIAGLTVAVGAET